MKKILAVFLWICVASLSLAQVKSSYLYNTSMPYGTLDIRTTISSTNYYYLLEGQTFAFRESSPGIKTNSYLDMTSWGDSAPYGQGYLRYKNGPSDSFIMNYRLLPPVNYNASYAEGYPLIVIVHGAVERGNCYYENCYHNNWNYDPNVNSPFAPKTATSKLLNNDHHLNIGAKQHLAARNLAGSKLPNDPTLSSKAFPGFVLMPQMLNVWDATSIQHLIRIVQLHCQKYKIDPNRVYIHGLSIGGYGVYEAIKRASWLFAAALPMSAITDADIFTQNQQTTVAHVPLWVFQGGKDTAPSPTYTNTLVNKLRTAGSIVRYSLYPDLSHNVWNKAYGEAEFFKWILLQNKANIHPSGGNTVIVKSQSKYPKLMLGEGFLAYQWEKNGAIISGVTSNTYTATTPGTYRARFSRVSSAPTASQWNKWSPPVTVTEGTAAASVGETEIVMIDSEKNEEFSSTIYPNPSTSDNVNLRIRSPFDGPVQVQLVDMLGKHQYSKIFDSQEIESDLKLLLPYLSDGMYVLLVTQGQRQLKQKLMVKN